MAMDKAEEEYKPKFLGFFDGENGLGHGNGSVFIHTIDGQKFVIWSNEHGLTSQPSLTLQKFVPFQSE